MSKIAIIEHMNDGHHDRVKQFFTQRGSELVILNPAQGLPLRGKITDYDATVVYGGAQSVNDSSLSYIATEVDWIKQCIAADRPVLGICLGAQLLTLALGGTVAPHKSRQHEIGFTTIRPIGPGKALFSDNATFYQWHNEGCYPGSNVELLATGDLFENQAFRHRNRQYGLQFHPEAAGTALERWWASVPDIESRPGCHPLSRQREDAQRYDPMIDEWTSSFLTQWQQAW